MRLNAPLSRLDLLIYGHYRIVHGLRIALAFMLTFLLYTFASVVAVINSVVGGSAVAIALGTFVDASLGPAAVVGAGTAIVSVAVLLRFADRLLDSRAEQVEVLFPSPPSAGSTRTDPSGP